MNEMLQDRQPGRLGERDGELRRQRANALRFLAIDAVEAANSGHPGMPMGMADIAEVLWAHFLKHNPGNPHWPDRDRFVVSNGHGSMLLYGLLHLSGYDLPLAELERFRQLGSKTPGHPEHGLTPGVETTAGPLGQGLANAVGMALAERELAAEFNRPGHAVVDHRTYVFTGDGCLMEGISHETCSLAGVLGLGKLTVLYDDNGISIDGEVSGWFRDDTPARFASYGWHVVAGVDGHDPVAIGGAIDETLAESTRPSLICCRTVIGYGAPAREIPPRRTARRWARRKRPPRAGPCNGHTLPSRCPPRCVRPGMPAAVASWQRANGSGASRRTGVPSPRLHESCSAVSTGICPRPSMRASGR